jgi:hypothetical protein
MKTQLKFMAVLVGVSLAVLATVFSAFASTPGLRRAGTVKISAAPVARGAAEKAAACTKMKASDVAWVTLTEDGEIDEQIEAYESGATVITPVFEYDCVPKKTTIVTVFQFNGEEIFSDKEPLKASNSKGLYGYPLSKTDESAVDEGVWGVAFYNNKTLLTESEIVVGEEGGDSGAVTVQGTVKDAKTKKAIKGATILVLQPGVTIKKFIDGGQKDDDVYTAAQTDGKGQFVLPDQFERNTEYSIIAVGKGYKPVGQDKFVIGDDDPNPLEMNVTLKK